MRRGSILLITLWLIAVLSALAIAIARQVSLELRVVNYRIARAQARALAQGGVRLAAAMLERDDTQPPPKFDSLDEEWAAEMKRSALGFSSEADAPSLTVTVVDEDRYVNLNAISKLENLSGPLGMGSAAQAILDDRDEAAAGEDHPNDTPPYQARNDAFTCVEQLSDVPGMTDVLLVTLRKAASPWRGASGNTLNLNTAPHEALVGFGFTPGGADRIEQKRKGSGVFKDLPAINTFSNEPGFLPEDLTLLRTLDRLTVTSSVFTIKATGVVPRSSVQYTIQAVMNRSAQAAGAAAPSTAPTVIAWREG